VPFLYWFWFDLQVYLLRSDDACGRVRKWMLVTIID